MDLQMCPERPRVGWVASANDYYCNYKSIIIVYYYDIIIITIIAIKSQIIIVNSIRIY